MEQFHIPAAGAAQRFSAFRPRRRHGLMGGLMFVALALTALSGTAGYAQNNVQNDEDGPPSAQGQIDIPNNITIFGKQDPNLRRPTAIVNGDIITGTDVDQRLALIVAANNGKIPADEMDRLRLQVLRNLIDETLEIQEAKTDEITIDNAEVNENYARVAQDNFHQSTAALDAYLMQIGSSPASLKRQIRGELAWQRVLRRDVQPFVNVSDAEVNELLARLKAEKGDTEYRIGEIYLGATPETASTVRNTADQIVEQLRKGGSFVAYARQYSEASTASVGGDLGWVKPGQLPTELQAVARDLPTGQLAGPIDVRGGFDIIYMIDRRQVLTSNPHDAILALKQISISLPAGISNDDAAKRAADFATALKQAKGCGSVDAIATKIGAQVVVNDQVPVRDLPQQLQDTVLKMSPGDMTSPFGSLTDGIRILMLCGRDDPKANNGPSFDDLMSQMQDERVNRRAQRYLRDLRRDAIIEYN